MPAPETPTEDPTAARRHQMEEEAMAFAAGYVASKCRHIDSSLGWPTCDVQPSDLAAVPSGWIETISRGQLFVPSAWWMAAVRHFNAIFSDVMGPIADQNAGILRRLIGKFQQEVPRVDQRVARKLATTRLHMRLRQLNAERNEARSAKRALSKNRQHSMSTK
ncbi:hypothetical protein FJT64_019865 [Amphibalanus amphitrite]|uniref:Uncharacterized protein n=1 Tax=Amphibalanus amphitrite TaxID=1232801 RepID=A0A6A4WYR8_AMPAM|nr:hypothetical protein FJT64_019865 [Amphibalanus amphitrite]